MARTQAALGFAQRTQAVLRRQLLEATDGGVQTLPAAILDAVNATVDRQALPAMPGVLHDAGVTDVGHLLNHVQLAQAVDALLFGRQLGQQVTVFVVKVANGAQPAIDQAELAVLDRGLDAGVSQQTVTGVVDRPDGSATGGEEVDEGTGRDDDGGTDHDDC